MCMLAPCWLPPHTSGQQDDNCVAQIDTRHFWDAGTLPIGSALTQIHLEMAWQQKQSVLAKMPAYTCELF